MNENTLSVLEHNEHKSTEINLPRAVQLYTACDSYRKFTQKDLTCNCK